MVRIFLTGYMGAGKTTLGKAFARKMNVPFVDLDWYIEERFHKTVGELFTERGETGFRELERNMLHEVAEFENVVISTGGGAPCFFDNMEFMNRVGKTVFLDVHPDVLFRRLRIAKQQRPILQGKEDDELKAFIIRALEQRAPFYTQAQYIFNADELADRNSRATIAGIVGTISYFTFTSHVNHMVSPFSFYLLFIFLGSLFCSFSQYLYLGARYEIFLLTINTRKKIKRLLWEL